MTSAVASVPTSAAARLQLVLARLVRAIRHHGATGLTPSQASALATIDRQGPMRISQLAAVETVGAPAATRVVAALEELGLVERAQDPHDKRACLVGITEQGRSVFESMWRERTIGLSTRLDALEPGERTALEAALGVLEKLAGEL